jgi:hypothetical protein
VRSESVDHAACATVPTVAWSGSLTHDDGNPDTAGLQPFHLILKWLQSDRFDLVAIAQVRID